MDTATADTQRSAEENPVERFLSAATLPPKKLRKAELPGLRKDAIAALATQYGHNGQFSVRVPDDTADDVSLGAKSNDPRWIAYAEEWREAFRAAIEDAKKRINDIPNPVERFMVVSEMANVAWSLHREMHKLRNTRRLAIAVLFWNNDWNKMHIKRYLDLGGQKDRRFIDSAVRATDRRHVPDWTEEEAARRGKRAHARYLASEELSKWARDVRDTMILELAEGRWDGNRRISDKKWAAGVRGRVWTPAELSRLAGLSTAAIATYMSPEYQVKKARNSQAAA